MESLKGKLLLASPGLFDPNFRRTAVLITEHTEEGAAGLVLNRPTETSVAEAVPPLAELVDADDPVYVGGPVEPGAVAALAEFDDAEQAAAIVFGEVGFVPGDADAALLRAATRRVRVFAGYAGWGAGQLEAELADSSWLVEPALEEDVFASPGTDVWGTAVRRKGRGYALIALMPEDPSLN